MFSRFRNIFSKSKKDKESGMVQETPTSPLEPENAADKAHNSHTEILSKAEATLKETSGENSHSESAKVIEAQEFKETVGDDVGKVKVSREINSGTAELTIQFGYINATAVESEKSTKDLTPKDDSIAKAEDIQESEKCIPMPHESNKETDKVANNITREAAEDVNNIIGQTLSNTIDYEDQQQVLENVKIAALSKPHDDKIQHEVEQNEVMTDENIHFTQNGSTYADLSEELTIKAPDINSTFTSSPAEAKLEVNDNFDVTPKKNSDLQKQFDTIEIPIDVTNLNDKILENSNEAKDKAIDSVSAGVAGESPTQITDIISKAKLDNYNSVVSTHSCKSMLATETLNPKQNTISNHINLTNITNDAITNDYSAMSDDLTNNEVITSPSTTDSGNGGSELNTTATTIAAPDASSLSSTLSSTTSSSTSATAAAAATITPTTLVVTPTGNNGIACSAITNKLTEISEVAESLDAAIRDAQEDADLAESQSTSSSTEKKLDNLRSASIEDWHSRSTEDESFVTASEGNFTPHSHSSSFQTVSGRTSSFISSDKNSFDASEADDSTFAFELPELSTPPPLHNISFESSEHSYLSAQQSPSPIGAAAASGKCRIIPIEIEPRNELQNDKKYQDHDHDQDSIVGIEELHSQSVTPTPIHPYQHHYESIPIESESEHEAPSSRIADAPSMEILTEVTPMTSVTPEVSICAIPPTAGHATNTNKPPNAAWRRNKYYENITKQTIKGFL